MSKRDPVQVLIYGPGESPVKDVKEILSISSRPSVTIEKRGKVNVRALFSLSDLLKSNKKLEFTLGDAVVDAQQLKDLVPNGNMRMSGYVVEARGTGHSNTSPLTLMAGLPDITRASFTVTKELSEEAAMPQDILDKLNSEDPFLTMLCSPTVDFPPGSALAHAMQIAREKYGMHLYAKCEDGGIMSQNPKALVIIDETIGATETTIKNTYFKDVAGRGIHTPSTSLISNIVRTYPPSAIRLVWNDQGGRVDFDSQQPTMFFIPHQVADHVIEYIMRRKKVISGLRSNVSNIRVVVQASPMHGDWHFDEERNEFENRDTGKVYNADERFEFCVELDLAILYHMPKPDSCALAHEHQFYPMPVWPRSGIVNGKPSSDKIQPYPGTLFDSVKEKLAAVSEKIEKEKRTYMTKRANSEVPLEPIEQSSSSAASSVADDD